MYTFTIRCCLALFQEAGADALSKGKIGTAPLNLKPWQEGPAAKTGKEVSAMLGGHYSALFT